MDGAVAGLALGGGAGGAFGVVGGEGAALDGRQGDDLLVEGEGVGFVDGGGRVVPVAGVGAHRGVGHEGAGRGGADLAGAAVDLELVVAEPPAAPVCEAVAGGVLQVAFQRLYERVGATGLYRHIPLDLAAVG